MFTKNLLRLFFLSVLVFCGYDQIESKKHLVIVGSGIVGAIEALSAFQEAKRSSEDIAITILEQSSHLCSTAMNIAPSLTVDEILAVIPPAKILLEKSKILFSKPGGIQVTDVANIEGTPTTLNFFEHVLQHDFHTSKIVHQSETLLLLGKMSMNMWNKFYQEGDQELRTVFDESNFNSCHESTTNDSKVLHDGYRIDLIYNVENALEKALSMKKDYESLGYSKCAILTPSQVMEIDPTLTQFCQNHSEIDQSGNLVWEKKTVALWRPGGCLFVSSFIPKLYAYLAKKMDVDFTIRFSTKVVGAMFENSPAGRIITALRLEDETFFESTSNDTEYVFAPGESIGTVEKCGFCEPAYAGFAGASLKLKIDIPEGKEEEAYKLNHCMEVCQDGIVLAWQSRVKDGKVFIAVAGTKAFYADQKPNISQEFALNRNLLQLNMINNVLPEYVSWAVGRDTNGQELTFKDLFDLEAAGIAERWVGIRAVAYDGFPTLGNLYTTDKIKIMNARCTTHLGSGGVSFAPAAVAISRAAFAEEQDLFTMQVLNYANSSRSY